MVLLLALLLTLAGLWVTTTRFAMTTNAAALLSPEVAWRVDERRLDDAFPQNGDVILVVIDGATPELAESAAARLAAGLAPDTRHFRRVVRPDGGAFFTRAGLLYADPAAVRIATERLIKAQPILGPLAADPSLRGVAGLFSTLARGVARGEASLTDIAAPVTAIGDNIAAQAEGRPGYFSWTSLLGDGGDAGVLAPPTRRLLLVRPVLDYSDLQPGLAAATAIRSAAAALQLDAIHGLRVRLTGATALDDEEFSSLADNIAVVAVAIVAAMLVVLWLATRSVRIVTAIMATTIAGLIVTAATGLLAVGEFNLISVAFIPLFVGLGVDFGIQIGVRFQAERRAGAALRAALIAAAAGLGPSLLLAAAAVALGFLAFLPTDYVGIAELGIISGIGMVVALAFSVSVLPALLVMLRPRAPAPQGPQPRLAALDRWLLGHRRTVLIGFAIAMVAGVASLALVRFDFNPLHLKNPRGEAVATLRDLQRDPDRSPDTVEILAPDLPAARALAARLATLPQVARALTVESFIPAGQAEKLPIIADANAILEFALDPALAAPPPSDAEVVAALRRAAADLGAIARRGQAGATPVLRLQAQLTLLADASPEGRARVAEQLIPPLLTMLDQLRLSLQAEPVTLATLPAEIRADWIAADGRAKVQLLPRGSDNASLEAFTAAVLAIEPHATGPAVSTQAAARTVAGAFVQAGALAFAIVSVLLFAVLRSPREVAFTLAPVVLSIFLTLGACVLIGQPINFANIIAFPLLFGVGVAFHIYFVMAWRAGGTDLLQSSLARGVFFSALATGMAFGALWLSTHTGTASMGKILLLSLFWTLVCALIFEPALLGPQRRRAG
ncbi:hopanoid biosynthesis-associated RND transporter HpnN [alpha proteobacterium AAP81b]|nr:hopanoid biosynthesis-associated RND transporter HpnN [alpha proteobacterium AAP81b]